MAVTRIAPIGAVLAALLGSATAARAEPCRDAAQVVLQTVERMSMADRAPRILAAFERDARLGCGVVPAAHWTMPGWRLSFQKCPANRSGTMP